MEKEKCQIRIAPNCLEISGSIDFISEIVDKEKLKIFAKEILSGISMIPHHKDEKINAVSDGKPTSLPEFIKPLLDSLDTNAKKFAGIAYYFEKYDCKDEFSVKEMQEAFKKLKLHEPKNIQRDLGKATAKDSFLLEGSTRSYYSLSRTGESFIDSLINK